MNFALRSRPHAGTSSPGFLARAQAAASASGRPLLPLLAIACACLPILGMLVYGFSASRNVAYWDELDTALAFMLRLQDAQWSDIFPQLLALGNEHRTVTSRVLFLLSYWLTGTIDFVVIGVIGNAFIVGAVALLVATAGTGLRKLTLFALLAFLLFQLQHYENFLWSGSSIDHFQVVLLACGALVALARDTRRGVIVACLLGLLATLTLVHGMVVWPAGAVALAVQRRWRPLAWWLALAGLTVAAFFPGFDFNPGHQIGGFSATNVARIGAFWLTLLGAPLALGDRALAPFFGLGLLAAGVHLMWRGAFRRERIAGPIALWAIGALFLVAVGRANVGEYPVYSRYYVLGALAWALVLFAYLGQIPDVTDRRRVLLRVVPLLAVFNLAANACFVAPARAWVISRDSAVHHFMHHGRDGVGPHTLHPHPGHASQLIERAEKAGVFRMPGVSEIREFPKARRVERLDYYVDHVVVEGAMIEIQGWAARAGAASRPGQVHVLLWSNLRRQTFSTLAEARPDVASAHPTEDWREAGFRFRQRRWLLPPDLYQIGLLIHSEQGEEFVLTAHQLDLTGEGRGVIADGG